MLNLEKYLTIDKKTHESPNLCDKFDAVDLRRIGQHCVDGYKSDLDSRQDWERRNRAGLDLALQVVKEKSFPWAGASNVAFPLITIAAMQFHARAYPAIITGKEVVRVKEYPGADPQTKQNCKNAAAVMNVQLLETSTAWEEGSDRLLLHYSIAGCAFKKSYFSSIEGDVVSEVVFAADLVLDYYAKSVESARRKSHRYELSRNTLIEGMRQDTPKYRNVEDEPWFKQGARPATIGDGEQKSDGTVAPPSNDPSTPFSFIEQHCWLDLDGDGYEEPYVVTIDLGSGEVFRIVARWDREMDVVRNGRKQIIRITATEYFTKYGFIPSPDGSIYDIGFGSLLGPLNESVSTIVNQLIDAGTMATTGGGFLGKGVKVRSGTYSFAPNEWKRVDSTGDDLRKNIVPLDVREPSNVLFQLLGLLIEYTNRIAGTMESMVGENPGQNTPKSNMDSMIEQGMKIYAAIFKRTWRSLKEEFRKIYVLNAIYQPPRIAEYFLGDPRLCSPSADPNISSNAERRTRAMLIAERAQVVPGYDPMTVEMNYLRALNVDNPEEFYKGPPQEPPPKDPKIVVEELRQAGADKDRQAEMQRFIAELQGDQRMAEAEILNLQAQSQKYLAEAKDAADNRIIVAMQATLALLKDSREHARGRIEQLIKIAELSSEPDRQTKGLDHVRRVVESSVQPSPPALLPPQAGGLEGAVGMQPSPV